MASVGDDPASVLELIFLSVFLVLGTSIGYLNLHNKEMGKILSILSIRKL